MKRNLLLLVAMFYLTATSFATIHMVTVADFAFTPSSLTAHSGDTIMWMWTNGTHTTTSTAAIPAGATPWNSNISSATLSFMYVPTVLGTYNYICSIHPTQMIASFTVVSAAEVPSVNAAPLFSAYPNPARGKVHLQFTRTGLPASVTVTDIVGRQVIRNEYSSLNETDLDLQNIPDGCYIISARQGSDSYRQQLVVAR